MDNLNDIFAKLDATIGAVDLSAITNESTGFSEVPGGYYLCEVEKASLGASKKGDPMIKFQFNIVEDGKKNDDGEGFVTLAKTKGRKLFKNYVIKDAGGVSRYVSDMLKFEDPNERGKPLLPAEAYKNHETIEMALQMLVGNRIYCFNDVKIDEENPENKSVWLNLLTWNRATDLGLTEEF